MSTPSGEPSAEDVFGDIDLSWKRRKGQAFLALCIVSTFFGIVMLALLMIDVAYEAVIGYLRNPERSVVTFLTEPSSRFPERAGFLGAILGSLWLMVFTILFSFFVGVGSAIYLEEYAPDNRITRLIEANLTNLAGVPSVVYGLLVLAIIVNGINLGAVILAGALALGLLVLPIVIVSSQEALRAVPDSQRRASYATGATQWQTIRQVVLPAAFPGMMTGTILALARAIGETAPLIMVGALISTIRLPGGPLEPFGAMPTEIYYWATHPDAAFHHLAAVGIVVLLAIMLGMIGVAVYLRNKFETEF